MYAKVQHANPDLFMPQVVHTKSCLTWSQYLSLSSTHTSLNPPPPESPGKRLHSTLQRTGEQGVLDKGTISISIAAFAILIQADVPAVGLRAGSYLGKLHCVGGDVGTVAVEFVG